MENLPMRKVVVARMVEEEGKMPEVRQAKPLMMREVDICKGCGWG